MAKFSVTGSSGRIGRAIHRLLVESNKVIGCDKSPSSSTAIIGDILDDEILDRCFDGAEAVFHTAALHAPHVNVLPDAEFHRINVDGTEGVFQAAKRAGVKTVIFTSTTALYGYASQQSDRASWVTEETEPLPRTIYHRTKLDAEQIAREYASSSLAVRVIRMSRCFPEPAPLMAVYRLHRGVDARDVATAHYAALNHDAHSFEIYNVSGLTPFAREDGEALKFDAPSVIQEKSPELAALFKIRGWTLPQSIDRVYNSAKAIADLKWSPAYDFNEVFTQLDRQSAEVLPPE